MFGALAQSTKLTLPRLFFCGENVFPYRSIIIVIFFYMMTLRHSLTYYMAPHRKKKLKNHAVRISLLVVCVPTLVHL